ncbi:MAG TPA: glycosyltransferase [Steroidobacteraceae bacterium]|nr:glycosyltransferase [Steroidobacteraceae bacterium]
MNATPTVSVLMPVYNGAAYLRAAMQSILNQSFCDFEFVVLDDGSTDGSLRILQEYARLDGRVRLLSRENRGLTYSLNQLIATARGEFMARMDADDIAMPERLARQVEFLRTHPGVLCVGGAFQIIDEAGRYLTTLYPPASNEQIQNHLIHGRCAISHPAAMARLQPIRELGGYQGDFAEDLDLWLRLGEKGELANLPEAVLRYRLHCASVSERVGHRQRDAALVACQAAWQRRGIRDGTFEGASAWRPESKATRYAFMLQYGWWAWNSRERATAQLYGLRALRARPLGVEGWKLLLVSLLKPLDAPVPQPSP